MKKTLLGMLALGVAGCGVAPGLPSMDRETAEHGASIVYGADDRTEYFDVATPGARARMAQSMVAFVPKTSLRQGKSGIEIVAPTWGEVAGLCPGEPFADQPAAAFCSGVLVDWDLVLTAGHCVRAFALSRFSIVFDYDYTAPGELKIGDDIRDPVAIVSEALDPEGAEPRLDYAWVRLDRPAAPPRQPAPIYTGASPLELGDSIVSIGAGDGVPIKLDQGGQVRDLRADVLDYFIADTDTSRGSSGGAAFDQWLSLTGILARGNADLVTTAAGCAATVHDPDGSDADEQFTYTGPAVAGLCEKGPGVSSLCRPSCGVPCRALPLRPPSLESLKAGGGCAVAAANTRSAAGGRWLLLLLAASCCRRARRRYSRHGAIFRASCEPRSSIPHHDPRRHRQEHREVAGCHGLDDRSWRLTR